MMDEIIYKETIRALLDFDAAKSRLKRAEESYDRMLSLVGMRFLSVFKTYQSEVEEELRNARNAFNELGK